MIRLVVYDTGDQIGGAYTAQPAPVPPQQVDAVTWVKQNLGFEPDPNQARALGTSVKRGILNCTRQWGKSTIAAIKAVHQAVNFPGTLTLVVSPCARQSSELVRKATAFTQRLGISTRGDGHNEVSLAFPNGSRIIGLPGTEATIRGFSAVSLLLMDEAARISDELYTAVRPMIAVSGGACWLMSTPHGKRGFFYDTWVKSEEPRSEKPDGKGDWVRISVPATDCPRIPRDFLEEERATMDSRSFRQEYLCEFFDLDLAEQPVSASVNYDESKRRGS